MEEAILNLNKLVKILFEKANEDAIIGLDPSKLDFAKQLMDKLSRPPVENIATQKSNIKSMYSENDQVWDRMMNKSHELNTNSHNIELLNNLEPILPNSQQELEELRQALKLDISSLE